MSGRLSTIQVAYVVARRDFVAILWSRSFIFFLLGPLFPVLVAMMAGGIGDKVQHAANRQVIGVAMPATDAAALLSARARLEPRLPGSLPELTVMKAPAPGESFDAGTVLAGKRENLAAIVGGSLAAPHLTGPDAAIERWQGPLALIAAEAMGRTPERWPEVTLTATERSSAQDRRGQLVTAQAGQMMLFLLTMLLAGMVLSNLVEEKGNKIIEILAAAVPMDAVFLGKLFAMLAVSFVGIAVWGLAGAGFILSAGEALPQLAAPAVGWPLFLVLGVIYFAMAYLLIGALFLTIGSMAATVREVQTLSMPVTFLQLIFFFLASYAIAEPDSVTGRVAAVVPFSSPFAMLARAAQDETLCQHGAALVWQALCVAVIIKGGANLFRTRVMKSGPAGGGRPKPVKPARA